jgi:acyl-CoA dehydrogenase
MRIFIFPRGLTYFAPSDRLGRSVVEGIINPTEARDRIAEGVYRTVEPGNALGLLQEALMLAIAAEPLEKRIRVEGIKTGRITALDLPGQIEAALRIGLIDDGEAATLREYDRKVMAIVNVDDFDSSEIGAEATAAEPVAHARVRNA